MKDNKQRLFEIMERINNDFHQNKQQFIIPIGISGSGKSRWIKSLEDNGFVVISPDDLRREILGSVNDQSRGGEIFRIAYQRIIDALNNGKNVVFDATNTVSKNRREMLKFLKSNVNNEFEASAKIFDVDPEISKERIRKDIETGVDRSNVPPDVIDRQYKQFKDNINNVESDGYTIIN